MRTVAVTGASGYLGRKLLQLLDRDDAISRVVAIDVAEPSFATRNLEFYRMDVRSPDLAEVIAGCDAIVHLAATAGEGSRSVNVGGTGSVADAAGAAHVHKLVFASTAAAYGAHPDNPVPLTEEAPLRPGPGHPATKAEGEGVVAAFAGRHPDAVTTVLRLARVYGPTVPATKAGEIWLPVRFVIDGRDPPVQALHEDDAAAALVFALQRDLQGTYNVAAADWITQPERVCGQRRIDLTADQAERYGDLAARVGLGAFVPDPAALMYPLVLSSERLRAAGFEPRHTTADALRAGVGSVRGRVSVGGWRMRPRWLAAAAVAAAAVAIGSLARPRRARG